METIMSVQVRQSQVRISPSFLATILGKSDYGNQVSVLQESGNWMKIHDLNTGVSGWMHSSALTKKKIVLKAGKKDVAISATSDEYALAGKGFNRQVENQYKSKNSNLDFFWIDKMERISVPPIQMQEFLLAGRVSPSGGVE